MEPILEYRNVSKAFPGVQELSDVSVNFMPGEVHALVGENGAGKSTLIKMLTGVNVPDQGEIYYNGSTYKSFNPKMSRKLGLGVMYQELSLVNELSVAENIFLGNEPRKNRFLLDRKKMEEESQRVFADLGVNLKPDALVGTLSVGYQQMVELCRAVVEEAKVLVLDEPTAPLSSNEVEILFRFIRTVKKKGITIIYISHRLDEIFEITDRITVLRDGKVITTKNTEEFSRDELIHCMVGRKLTEIYEPREGVSGGEVVLETRNLSGNGVKNISLKAYRGEILGLGGLVGAGRTEFAELLYGHKKRDSGEMYLNGKLFSPQNPGQAQRAGVVLVPEDRKQQGLLLDMTVKYNQSLPIVKQLSRYAILNEKEETKLANYYCDNLGIKTPSLKQKVKNLSGGNQQKVVIAKGLASEPELIIIDEPTRGVDVGAKRELYHLMNQMIEQGKTIIMISSDME
ncbi:MAG: sugar ABC transporter ATP-binding protein, partial [Lachnospiraceae bacterium]|nr:sugar ABC transporter ATP-binding protein [Lachnospiraceae bacterium]